MPKRRITASEYKDWLIDMAALRFVEGHSEKVVQDTGRSRVEAVS